MITGRQALLLQELSIRVQTGGVELIQELADDWRRLCDEDPATEPFYRPEWTEAFLRAFAPSAKMIVISAWSGQRLGGVLPLIEERGFLSGLPVKRMVGPANVHCCRLGLAYLRGAQGEETLRALWQAARELPGWDLFDFDSVLEGNGIDKLGALAAAEGFRVARKPAFESLYLPFTMPAGEPPGWLECTRPNFRSNLRRRRRRLEELGIVSSQHYDTADPQALERFYQVERSGWKGKQGTAIACDPRTRLFYDEVAKAAARDGYLSLDFLELNAKPIAAHFALSFHGRYFLAKPGYDEAYQRYGPGHLLVHEVLSRSEQRGLRELDFVGPSTWHESRWARARRKHFRIFIFRRGWYGKLLHAVHITGRQATKRLLWREADQSPFPVEKSLPQGFENSSGNDS